MPEGSFYPKCFSNYINDRYFVCTIMTLILNGSLLEMLSFLIFAYQTKNFCSILYIIITTRTCNSYSHGNELKYIIHFLWKIAFLSLRAFRHTIPYLLSTALAPSMVANSVIHYPLFYGKTYHTKSLRIHFEAIICQRHMHNVKDDPIFVLK